MPRKILIVGGVAGGATVATRCRRLDESAEIKIFERGEHISFANCGLPYYVGNVIAEREDLLLQSPERMKQRYNIDVFIRHEVTRILPEAKMIEVADLTSGSKQLESYDKLILSPGARPVKPPIAGMDGPHVYTLRNMGDADYLKEILATDDARRVLVIGGGFIGLEMAENIQLLGKKVTLVEKIHLLTNLDAEMAFPVQEHVIDKGIDVIIGDVPERISHDGPKTAVVLASGRVIETDAVIVGIGVRPETTLAAEAGLRLGERGGIAVNDYLQTSDPDIYALGDAAEVKHFITGQHVLMPLAGPANRQARVVANNVMGGEEKYDGVLGTFILKIFDLSVASTGLNEKTLRQAGLSYEKCYTHAGSHAGYYPGSATLSMKMLFDPADGRIYGAQAVGKAGVDKRIDVLATAIKAGMTVFDLQRLELCYAPPYSSAKDPVNYLGYVAANIMNNHNPVFHVPDLEQLGDDALLLDVRTEEEYAEGYIEGAWNIPLDELRRRAGELPRDKEIYIYCKVGLRGYLAARILSQKGFRVKNLSGGYTTFRAYGMN